MALMAGGGAASRPAAAAAPAHVHFIKQQLTVDRVRAALLQVGQATKGVRAAEAGWRPSRRWQGRRSCSG
jgi:hypothetical protein